MDCYQEVCERSTYRQTSNLLPLEAGLVPAEVKKDVVERLVQDVCEKDCHPDTGCVGTRLLLPVLADNGYEELAWKLMMQDTYPSWGFWLKNGGDCPWEGWELEKVGAKPQTVRGELECSWEWECDDLEDSYQEKTQKVRLHLIVPCGMVAQIQLPADKMELVKMEEVETVETVKKQVAWQREKDALYVSGGECLFYLQLR